MPEVYDALIGSRKKVFDTLTGLTRSVGTVALLKQSPTADAFVTVLDLTDSWFFKAATTKQNALLEVARDDATMTAAMDTATHVELGSDIFVIVQADTIPPSGFSVTWKIFVEMFTKKSQIQAIY